MKITIIHAVVIICSITGISLLGNSLQVNGQSQEELKKYDSSKFGISLQYPSDWKFEPEDEEFNNKTYGHSYGSATLGIFCPSLQIDPPPAIECGSTYPPYLQITAYKLKNGTTLEQFYEQDRSRIKDEYGLLYGLFPTETRTKNNVKVSGLPAIESTVMEKRSLYVVNKNIGYHFFTISDEDSSDTWSPMFKDMIDSVQLK